MLRLRDISADLLIAHWDQHTSREGLLAAAGIGGTLLAGVLSGHPAAAAISAGSTFMVGFAVFHPVLRSVLLSMLLLTAALASTTLAGSLCAPWTGLTLAIVGIAALNYGLLSGMGSAAGWLGLQSGVFLVIATYFPGGVRYAAARASLVVLGGLLQMLLHAVAFRISPHRSRPSIDIPAVRQSLGEHVARLRTQLRPGSDTLGYTARLVVTLLLGTTIYRTLHLRNGYWVPMTALLVLQPQWSGTVSRSFARLSGTLLGATLAFGLAHMHHWSPWLLAGLVMLCAWACYAVQAVNYAMFSFSITLYIVFLFRFGGFSEQTAAHLRLINTAIGGSVALAVDLAWRLLRRPASQLSTPSTATAGAPASEVR